MIDRIVIENFKSLRRVELTLGRVNLLIGANASGKSNFLDALRVLQGTQIVATTHSPRVLEWLQEEDYETTFVCKRDEETGATEIRPLTEVPHFMDVVKKPEQRISDLFAEGWLEAAL